MVFGGRVDPEVQGEFGHPLGKYSVRGKQRKRKGEGFLFFVFFLSGQTL